MDPMCTKECCMGCQVQFPKLVSQKNCIINICKCKIIEINYEEINNKIDSQKNINDTEIKEEKDLMSLSLILNNKINIKDINENNYEYYYYWFLAFVLIFYEGYILYNFNLKDNKFSNIQSNSDLVLEKDKEKRINDYMELIYNDEELIESLI